MSRPTVLLPLLVFGLNLFVFYSFITDLCLQLTDSMVKRTSFVVAEAIFCIMSSICLCIAAMVQPGKVPEKFQFTEEEHSQFINSSEDTRDRILQEAITRKHLRILTFTKSGHIRYCMACKSIKPDRAHHCSVCKICVLKMDHHCPWINNCVGFFNYKIFILLLFYHTFFCYLLIGGTIEILIKDVKLIKDHILLLAAFSLSLLEGLFTTTLLLYHIVLTFLNRTSIETFQKILFVDESYGFNLGKLRNWVQVFGSNVFLWFFPIHTSIGDGYNFSVSCGDIGDKSDRYIPKYISDVNWGDS